MLKAKEETIWFKFAHVSESWKYNVTKSSQPIIFAFNKYWEGHYAEKEATR